MAAAMITAVHFSAFHTLTNVLAEALPDAADFSDHPASSPVLGAWNLLALSLGLLLLAVLCTRLKTRLTSRRLRRIAFEHRMRYSAIDRFHLAPRVAEWLASGAADVRVRDLMYRVGASTYVYVFTAEYAIGTVGGIKRRRIVGSTCEPVGRSVPKLAGVLLADARQSLDAQYVAMIAELPCDDTDGAAAV